MTEKLDDPFPSAPGRPAKHQIRAHYGSDLGRFMLLLFSADYSARAFVDAIVETRPKPEDMTWERDTKLTIEWKGNIAILEGTTLQDIFEYEMSPSEEAWKLPKPYSDYASAIKTGVYEIHRSGAEKRTEEVEDRKERHVEKKAKREKKPRASREGLISIAQICEDMGWDAREARSVMRQLEWEKPDAGWAWPKSEVKDIKAKLKKEIKG